MKFAIDAMGGDHAPVETVKGSVETARQKPDHTFILVGQKDRIQEELDKNDAPKNIQIHPASEVIGMSEHPVDALRSKRDSSISWCARLAASGEVQGIMSAGNTGALAAASIIKLGMLEGVKRAGIMVPIPTPTGFSGLIDAGANLNCDRINFLHYAIMASTYMKLVNGTKEPSVGLVNVGEEPEKGTKLLQETHQLFQRFLGKRFIGNAEGHDIFQGKADVYVCDGFVGNVVLKMGEGLISTFAGMLLSNGLKEDARREVSLMAQRFDYTEYGGAPLLGVNSLVMIAHGRSNAKAIANAVARGVEVVEKNFLEKMHKDLSGLSLWRRFQKWFEEKWFEDKVGKEG